MLLAKGLHFGTPDTATDEAEEWLDRNCELTSDKDLDRDFGAQLKLKFGPAENQMPWRVEVRRYDCGRAADVRP